MRTVRIPLAGFLIAAAGVCLGIHREVLAEEPREDRAPALTDPFREPSPAWKRPRIEIDLGQWLALFRGSATNHPDWAAESLDFQDDLDLAWEFCHRLDLKLRFPRGPRFRLGVRTFRARGDVPADRRFLARPHPPVPPEERIETGLDIEIYDLAFCPLIWEARWGSLFVETGFRYLLTQIDVSTESDPSYAEGFQLTLSGELGFPLYRDELFAAASVFLGFGHDSAGFEAYGGVLWKPMPPVRLRLGLRFSGLIVTDRTGEATERRLSWTAGGPELAFVFVF